MEAAAVQLLHHGEGVVGRGHVDEAIIVDDDNVDDSAESAEESSEIASIHCIIFQKLVELILFT